MSSYKQLTRDHLEVIAATLADEATRMGVRGAIIAVSSEDNEHSNYWVTHRGPCLEAEGLSTRVAAYIGELWNGKIMVRR